MQRYAGFQVENLARPYTRKESLCVAQELLVARRKWAVGFPARLQSGGGDRYHIEAEQRLRFSVRVAPVADEDALAVAGSWRERVSEMLQAASASSSSSFRRR
jgi:hypothetical protein